MKHSFQVQAAAAAFGLALFAFSSFASAGERSYHNDRYGFSAVWPDDTWSERESDNGDGITVSSGDGLVIRTWGAMDIAVPGMTFDDFTADMRRLFDRVSRQKAARSRGEVSIRGVSEGRTMYLRAFQKKDCYVVMTVSCPAGKEALHGPSMERILAGFAYGDGQPAGPVPAVSGEAPAVEAAFVSGLMERFPSGRNVFAAPDSARGSIFLLKALRPVEISFHAAMFDEKTGMVSPERKVGGFFLEKGEFGCFRYTVPEGMPSLVVKAGDITWIPSFSGEDGRLLGAPGVRIVPSERLVKESEGAFPASPGDSAKQSIPMIITDRDPAGTNLRTGPSGDIAAVLPFGGMRAVSAGEEKNGWFRVWIKDSPANGWMHGNVLGICPQVTDAGMPAVYPEPRIEPEKAVKITEGTPLRPLRRSGNFIKVRYRDGRGAAKEGWMTVSSVTALPMEMPHCAKILGAD